jgi:hypothetical protein
MYYARKLKPDWDITGLLPALFAFITGILAALIFGPYYALKYVGSLVLLYAFFGMIAAYRTKNKVYILSTIYLSFLGFYILSLELNEYGGRIFHLTSGAKLLLLMTVAFGVTLIYMALTRQAKWRGTEIMELAAFDVEAGDDSYTDRPAPVARLDYTKDEIVNFAEFLKRKLVALPYYESERVVLIPIRMGKEFRHLFGGNVKYWDNTWVAFDYSGEVSAYLSKKDYLNYRENLSCSQLTKNLGELFIEFYEYFKKGEEVRIIDKVNEVKVGIMS